MQRTTTKLDTDISKLTHKGRINGKRYWMASQVADAMGLPYDDDFKSVINGAMGLCYRDGENANNHFLEIKSLEDGDGDYILSENAVYLIGTEYNDFNIRCEFGNAKYHQFGFVDTERRSRFYVNDRVRIHANPSDWPNANFVGMEGTVYEFQGDKVRVIVKGRIGTYDRKDIELIK